jgi:capsular polysaccharide biosynthesis protein
MRFELNPLFGAAPADVGNLEIGGAFQRRFEEKSWATVWPGSGVIRWQDGTIETETIWIEGNLKDCSDYHSRWSCFPRRMRGHYFNLSLFWWRNYYHWLCDVLCRLHGVLERLSPDIRIILPPKMTPFHRHSLELLGVPLSRCIPYEGWRPWKVERLYYASPVAMTANFEPQSLLWMRAKMLNGCLGRSEIPLGERRLYVSRSRAPSRRIVNEAELLPILRHYGFDVIDPGLMSFEEQVRTFSGAAVIAGPHGAGLTNQLWCGRGAKLFEIFEPGSVRPCYGSLARVLGHSYACGVGDAVSNDGAEPNMQVSVDAFESALKGICRSL